MAMSVASAYREYKGNYNGLVRYIDVMAFCYLNSSIYRMFYCLCAI